MEYIDIDSAYDFENETAGYTDRRVQSIIDAAYDMYDLEGYINID